MKKENVWWLLSNTNKFSNRFTTGSGLK